MDTELPAVQRVLAVCAHPDDESFGLGAILARFRREGAQVSVLCFTRGEASTLRIDDQDLAVVRWAELEAAAQVLGIQRTELLAYPDGGLQHIPLAELEAHVTRLACEVQAELLLVFDEGGITGHPDHMRATEAACVAAGDRGLPVLAWAIPREVTEALNTEFGAGFVGREAQDLAIVLQVDRAVQVQAIRCHVSQLGDNPVLWRRLELLGSHEWLRSLSVAAVQPG